MPFNKRVGLGTANAVIKKVRRCTVSDQTRIETSWSAATFSFDRCPGEEAHRALSRFRKRNLSAAEPFGFLLVLIGASNLARTLSRVDATTPPEYIAAEVPSGVTLVR